MIFSKVHFHSGAKRCIPCCVTWSESRWVSHNFLVIVTLLTLCFHKSSSWGCLREPRRDLHSSAQLGLPLTKKHIIFSSTHKHFSWNLHAHTRKGKQKKVNQLWKVWKCDPATEMWCELSPWLCPRCWWWNVKLCSVPVRSGSLW